jgi:hypothetical protein
MYMEKLIPLTLASVALLILCGGCATITRGTTEALVVESDPPGASVHLSSGLSGYTPTSFTVKRGQALVVTITKAGYEQVTVNVTPQIASGGAAGMAGNIIFGGLIGAAVDAGSGAMKELKPNPIRVNLHPTTAAISEKRSPASVAVR